MKNYYFTRSYKDQLRKRGISSGGTGLTAVLIQAIVILTGCSPRPSMVANSIHPDADKEIDFTAARGELEGPADIR